MTIALTPKQVDKGPNGTYLRSYFKTAWERYAIHQRRRAGEQRVSWTSNPIFKQYKFCNVYREDDRVTIWLRENWREPYKNHKNLAFAMVLARLINWPPTLMEIGFPKRFDADKVYRNLNDRKAAGEKIYTGAYLLGAVPTGVDRSDYLSNQVLEPLYSQLNGAKRWSRLGASLESWWDWFRSQRGLGPFLAYEVVSDLRHTRYLENAPDIMTWANAGPGALRGLTRVWGYQPKTRQIQGYSFPRKNALEAMQMLLKLSKEKLPKNMPPWEMREVEHWLCEFDKYERIRLKQGVLETFKPSQSNEW